MKQKTKSVAVKTAKEKKPVTKKNAKTTKVKAKSMRWVSPYANAMKRIILSISDDEVFSLMEMDRMVKESCNAPGRARDWIKEFPGHYVQLAQQTTVVGSKNSIQRFCVHHKIINPWQK